MSLGIYNKKGCRGHIQSEETRKKISETIKKYKKTIEHQTRITKALKGRIMPDGFYKRLGDKLRGRKHPTASIKLKGRHLSPKTEFQKGGISLNKGRKTSPETRLKQRLARLGRFSGIFSPSWKGGITPKNLALRTSDKFKQWRRDIFIRDKFTCRKCGLSHTYITAHHIKSFAYHPDLRFDINNGITLCKECHKETDNYAGRAKKIGAIQ
jgi:hypothetical protein